MKLYGDHIMFDGKNINLKDLIKLGSTIETEIVDWTLDGRGVGKFRSFTIFVNGGIGAKKCLVRITKVKKSYAEGDLVECLEKSDKLRQIDFDPRPLSFSYPFLEIDEAVQAQWKKKMIQEQLRRLGGVDADVIFHPYPHMEYRNKVNLRLDGEGYLSYSIRGTNELLRIDNDPFAVKRIQDLIGYWQEIVPGAFKRSTGQIHRKIRMVIFRANLKGQTMIVLVTDPLNSRERKELFDAVGLLNSHILCTCENKRKGDISLNGDFHYSGENRYLDESLMGLKLRLSPASFLQVNVFSIEDLYTKALDLLGNISGENVLDLYCGIGITSVLMEKRGARVLGIELDGDAVNDAKENASLNGASNVEFIRGRVEDCLNKQEEFGADLALVDPPEKGMDGSVTDAIKDSNIKRLVYVSCNPSSLSRDVRRLSDGGFIVQEVHGFDQFFCTGHVEAIALIQKM